MSTGQVAIAMWGLILGYWVLYNGIQRLTSLGSGSKSGSQGGGDPREHPVDRFARRSDAVLAW